MTLSGFEHIVRDNEPMSAHTWFRLGGPAEYFAEPTSVDELAALVKHCRENEISVRLLGSGSNVLVRDEGIAGMIIQLTAPAFSEITVDGNVVRAGGGAKLAHLISTAVREGLAGLEELVGIPGSVGGALRGNASSDNSDIGHWTVRATVMTRDGDIITREKKDLNFAYRRSSLDELVILSGEFQLETGDSRELTKRMHKLWIEKKSETPTSDQHAGFVFKNPVGVRVEDLIDQAGLKGASVGEAEVSDRYPNFIIANPGASSADVMRLIDLIRSHVSDRLGVDLQTAIQIW